MFGLKQIDIAETTRDLERILVVVRDRGERFVVERNGKPMAALVPLGDVSAAAEKPPSAGFLGLVGVCADAPEYADELDAMVRARHQS